MGKGSGWRMSRETTATASFDLARESLRQVNQHLHDSLSGRFEILNPDGRHAVACGLNAHLDVEIMGHVGYYCAGMNQLAHVRVRGNAGTGLAENIMSGSVVLEGHASQSAGATGRGGLLVIHGNAGARCGISMKGVDVVVRGSVGHLSGFMAQKGALVVCGDAGEALGDSLYEAHLYIRGKVAGLGADCIEKPFHSYHLNELQGLLERAGFDDMNPADFRRYGTARQLYNFKIDNADAY